MTLVQDLRKSVADTTAGYAVIGVTDLVVEKAREARDAAVVQATHALGQIEKARGDLDVKALQTKAQQAPARAVDRGLQLVAKVEETYGDLAERGAQRVGRIKQQRATQELLAQGKATLSKGKAAVTTVRQVAESAPSAVKDAATGPKSSGKASGTATAQTTAQTTAQMTTKATGGPSSAKPAAAKRSAKPSTRKSTRPAQG
jgi:heparin binding hemagglutinin HbhA